MEKAACVRGVVPIEGFLGERAVFFEVFVSQLMHKGGAQVWTNLELFAE